MSEPVRRFARFRRGPDAPRDQIVYFEVPSDGFCLNAYVVIHDATHPERVLLGRLDRSAPWNHLEGLDDRRVLSYTRHWVLPASHLLVFESPRDAAHRVVREQLESGPLDLQGPDVLSEVYHRIVPTPGDPPVQADPAAPSDPPARGDPHWDLHFVFHAKWTDSRPPNASPWRELAFVDVSQTSRSDYSREHGDILALTGLPLKD
jgi:hypothetical protein